MSLIIDSKLFKNIQSSIKREVGISVQTEEIREFVLANQDEMNSNGGKAWVVRHFVDQIRSQQSSITPISKSELPIYIPNIYSDGAKLQESVGQVDAIVPTQETQASSLTATSNTLPSEILKEVQQRFSHSQEVQAEIVNYLQDQQFTSALELRQKLGELANVESKILSKILSDYRNQHESNLLQLRATLNQSKSKASENAQVFTQTHQNRLREMEAAFGL